MAKKTASKSAPKKAADKVDKKTVKKVEAKKPAPVAAKKAATKATKTSLAEKIVAKAGKVVAQVEKAISGKSKSNKPELSSKGIVAKNTSNAKAKTVPTKESSQLKDKAPVAKAKTNEKILKSGEKVSTPATKPISTKEKSSDGPKMMSKSSGPTVKSLEKSNEEPAKIKIDRQAMSEDEVRWAEFYNKHRSETPPEYNIREQYESKRPIMHKTFGWGFILSNEYDRLEVLFKDGKRMLISNRKV